MDIKALVAELKKIGSMDKIKASGAYKAFEEFLAQPKAEDGDENESAFVKVKDGRLHLKGSIGTSIFAIIFGIETGITIAAVREAIEDLEPGFEYTINSPGGDLFEGVEIYYALQEAGCGRGKVEGMAASAGSVVSLAGGKPEIPAGSTFMIHNPHSSFSGDYQAMTKAAEVLEEFADAMVEIYSEVNTDMSAEEIKTAMAEETFYRSQKAVAAGWGVKPEAKKKKTKMKTEDDITAENPVLLSASVAVALAGE